MLAILTDWLDAGWHDPAVSNKEFPLLLHNNDNTNYNIIINNNNNNNNNNNATQFQSKASTN